MIYFVLINYSFSHLSKAVTRHINTTYMLKFRFSLKYINPIIIKEDSRRRDKKSRERTYSGQAFNFKAYLPNLYQILNSNCDVLVRSKEVIFS
jgi:hypothetical protein